MIAVFFPRETDPCSRYRDSRSSYEKYNDIIVRFMIFLSFLQDGFIIPLVWQQSIQPVVASSTAAAGLEPVLPVSKTGVLTCYTKPQETMVRFELTLTVLQTVALPAWLHCHSVPGRIRTFTMRV